MDITEPHAHKFAPGSWPFAEPVNTVAISTPQVLRQGDPVLVVYHDHDGEWQFLHGDVTEDDEGLIVCMGCAFERTPAIGELAAMPAGWRASREAPHAPWVKEPYGARDDDDEI